MGYRDRTAGCDARTMKRPRSPSKPQTFSKVQAVKHNARARVGTPPPERVLPSPEERRSAKAGKHKETLAELLTPKEDYLP